MRYILLMLMLINLTQISSATVSSESIPSILIICEQPIYGINTSEINKEIDYGSLYPGESSESQIVYVTIQQKQVYDCGYKSINVSVDVIVGEWNTPEITTTIINPNVNPIYVNGGVDNYPTMLRPIEFIATASKDIVPGIYNQIITFSMTF